MNNGLSSQAGSALFDVLTPNLKSCLGAIDALQSEGCRRQLVIAKLKIRKARRESETPTEDYLNDICIMRRYVDFLEAYGRFWRQLVADQFAESWNALQDCLDLLRFIKRFAEMNVAFFEAQLLEAERLYPYKVFASIGCTVGHFECSLCGREIDSDECTHRPGHLYYGKIATAIARDVSLEHIAVVTNPADKRCVVTLSNSPCEFPLAKYLSSLVKLRNVRPLTFKELQFSKKLAPNPTWIELPRNHPCYCGSGKKFKKCCIAKQHTETDHVDIIYREGPDFVSSSFGSSAET